QLTGWRREGGDELVQEGIAQALERSDGNAVLPAGQGRLAGQVVVGRQATGNQFEDRIGTQGIVVILVLVAGEDAVQAGAEHLQARVLNQAGVAGVVDGRGELGGEAEALIELADGEQPGIGGEQGRGGSNGDRQAGKSQRLGRRRVYTHGKTSGQGPR